MTGHVSFTATREGRYAFISYSRADVEPGFQYLEPLAHEGFHLWYDNDLTLTREWNAELAEVIAGSSLFILLVSPVSVERPVVAREVQFARDKGKPVLAVHLVPTAMPDSLHFQTLDVQALLASKHSFDEVVSQVRGQLVDHRIDQTRREDRRQPVVPTGAAVLPEDMPGARDRRAVTISDAFADRVPESEALAAAVAHQNALLLGERRHVDGVNNNVLTFYGGAGVGKSGLSQQLERWVRGGLSEGFHWGPWRGGPVVPIRWDFNDSQGDVQYASLLSTLRQGLSALRDVQPQFLAFDLALAAYLEAVSPDRQSLGLKSKARIGVLSSLQTIAARLQAGVPDELSAANVQRVVDRLLNQDTPGLLARFQLEDFLLACEVIPQGSQASELVADLIYLLTQEIFYLPPDERPRLVVFIDHFERIQRHTGHDHEPHLARIISRIPYALFVVTGRDKIAWADIGFNVDEAGPHAWPGLADTATLDPRQHLLGRLSREDTKKLYTHHLSRQGWQIDDPLVERLVSRSGGLPIHIEAVVKVALRLRRDPDVEQLPADLDEQLPGVVEHLLRVLTPAEAEAFRAACVLPFFTKGLAAVVGNVFEGDVARAIRFALVEDNHDSVFPYRVHDEIRRLVQRDRNSPGHWDEGDWQSAARRGLDAVKAVIQEAHDAEHDDRELKALALAIRLAHEWDLRNTGLETMVVRACSIRALAPLLPTASAVDADTESGALIRFVQAYSLPYPHGADALLEVSQLPAPIARNAARFRAYRLRSHMRHAEALEIFGEQTRTIQDRDFLAYTHFQYAITLRGQRRFRDCMAYARERIADKKRLERFEMVCLRLHGDFTTAMRSDFLAYRDLMVKSSRTRLEVDVSNLVHEFWQGLATRQEAMDLLRVATERRARGEARTCLRILGYFSLADGDAFTEIVERVQGGIDEDGSTAGTASNLRALRALYTKDPADARAAFDSVRSGFRSPGWISTEVWLEELGHPLEPLETQWLIPYEQVRGNWMGLARGAIERARASSVASGMSTAPAGLIGE